MPRHGHGGPSGRISTRLVPWIVLGAVGCAGSRAGAPPPPPPAPPAPAPPARSAPSTERWAAARGIADAKLGELHGTEGMPGVQAAVLVDGDVVWQAARGSAADGAPLTTSTRMPLASVSKVATALILGRLVAAGRVDLDAPVTRYVPTWPEPAAPIRVRQLAGHLGGIRHYTRSDFGRSRRYDRLADAVADIFAADARVAAPGTRYVYSSWGYTLLGAVLESAGQAPFLALLERELTRPAGLTLTGDPDASARLPAAGLLGTAADLVRLGNLLLPASTYLPRPLIDVMLTPQQTSDGTPTGVGLGWRVGTDGEGRRIAHHAGNMQGARTVVVVYLDAGVVVALLSNQMSAPVTVEAAAGTLAAPFLAGRVAR